MDNAVLVKVINKYNLGCQQLMPSQNGYRNRSYPFITASSQKANIILYKTEPGITNRIKRANFVSDYLYSIGLPARRTLNKRIIALNIRNKSRYCAVYEYLPGYTIPWEAYTKLHIKLLGQMMAWMHTALDNIPKTPLPHVVGEYLNIAKRMHSYFSDPQVCSALQQKTGLSVNEKVFKTILITLRVCEKLPNQQVLHMDFVRSNILFSGSQDNSKLAVSGILDFEKTAYGHIVFDIARTMAFLMVDCKNKTPGQVHKYFLISGYIRRGGNGFQNIILNVKDRKINVLDSLINLFLLYDFYKFLRHNPYEYLYQNEHFIKTKKLLLERSLICSIKA